MPKLKRTATIALLSVALLTTGGLAACSKTQTTESLLSDARQYQSKGDYKSAIIQLKNALQKSPDNAEARYLLGAIYVGIGDMKSAEKELRRALSLGFPADRVLPELGAAMLAEGQFQELIDQTNQPAVEHPSAAISTLRGNAYLALNKGKEAKSEFELALKNKPGYPAALLGLSKYALIEKNIAAATDFSDQAVTQNPDNTDVLIFRGDLLRSQGKIDDALAAYDQVLKLQPGNVTAHINKAFIEIAAGKFEAAKSDIEAARKSNPNNLMVSYIQALLDFRQEKFARALESLQQVLKSAPDHLPSILLAGAVQFSLGSMPQAEEHLRKYIEKDPGNLYAQKLLAAVLMKSGQTQATINILTTALKDARQDVQLLSMLGEAHMKTGDYAKATEYFTAASALAPKTSELHTALGLSKLAQGESDRGVAEMETAVKLNTKSPQAGIMLAMTQLRLKQYDKALVAAQAIAQEQPDNVLAYNLKGAAYLGKQDIASARTSFEKALSIEPANFAAAVNLAQLDVRAKKPEAAKKRFESILVKDKKNAQIMNALANLALSQGQIKEATSWMEKAAAENPDVLQPALQLIAHYLRIGEKKLALTQAKRLEGANTSNPDFLDVLAQAQFANDDKTAALETYGRLATLRPESAPAQMRIATMHIAMKNFPEAMTALKKALSLQPDNLEAQLTLASLESITGDTESALTIARQIQRHDKKLAVGYELEGNLLMQQKKPDLAVKAFEQAMAISPNGTLMVKLHSALLQTDKANTADTRLSAWIKAHPDDIPTHMYQAGLQLDKKQYQMAKEHYLSILKQAPNYLPALNNMAWLLQQEKDPRALEYAEKANQVTPDNPSAMDTLAWILLDQRNTARALPLLQKAATLGPQFPEIRYHLAVALMKSGNKAQARKELEQLLKEGKQFPAIDEARALLRQL